jgi:hypothetical protein
MKKLIVQIFATAKRLLFTIPTSFLAILKPDSL